jgi:hypothetical protein
LLCEGADCELREQVKSVLYAKSDAGQYTLEQTFEVAEKIDLATAYAEEMDNSEDDEIRCNGWTS